MLPFRAGHPSTIAIVSAEIIDYPLPSSRSRCLCGTGDRCYIRSERRCGILSDLALNPQRLVLVTHHDGAEWYPLADVVPLPPGMTSANVEEIEIWLADTDPSRLCDMED